MVISETMLYLWPITSNTPNGNFGVICSPSSGSIPHGIVNGREWAIDNEVFTKGFDPDRYFPYLERLKPYIKNCLFVVVPDVVGDSIQTLSLYRQWVRHFGGWPVAFVAQDGQFSTTRLL